MRALLRLMLLGGALASAALASGGCLQADAGDGLILCSTIKGRECPMGYYCEPMSNSCWHNGDFPDMAGPAEGSDLSYPQFPAFVMDLSATTQDMSTPDLSTSD
jgi:hypothetical protein